MSNRFGQLGGDSKGAGGGKKGKKREELAGALATGDAVPLLNQRVVAEGTKLRGFHEVEVKANVRPKGKPRTKPAAGGDEVVYAGGFTAIAPKPKAKPAPKRNGPIGGDVITEAQLKAEKKALEQQRRAIAMQRVKPVVGDAVTAKTKKENEAKLGAAKAAAPQPKSSGAHKVVAEQPEDLPEAMEDLPKPKKRPQPKKQHVDPSAAPKPRGKKGATAAPAGGSTHIAAAERQSATNHEHLADGSVVAMTKFCFVIGTKTTALVGGKGLEELAAQLATSFKSTGTLIGGFYIVAEGKHFSDHTTVDQPWMAESYYKALLQVLRDKKPEAVAYPFWPKAAGKKGADEVEAQVRMHIVSGTALEMEHVDHGYSLHVSIKKCKVSLKHFVRDLVAQGGLLLQLKEKLGAALPEASREKAQDLLGARLEELVNELSAVAAPMLQQ